MFKSQYRHNLDDKGRLVLPTKFREELGEGAIITTGYDGCLMIYTAAGWQKQLDDLLSKPMSSAAVRRNMRVLAGNASDVEIDKSGRIKIPDYLISGAGIIKDVTIVGSGSVIEIWATDRWLKELEQDQQEFESNAEQLYFFEKGDK